ASAPQARHRRGGAVIACAFTLRAFAGWAGDLSDKAFSPANRASESFDGARATAMRTTHVRLRHTDEATAPTDTTDGKPGHDAEGVLAAASEERPRNSIPSFVLKSISFIPVTVLRQVGLLAGSPVMLLL